MSISEPSADGDHDPYLRTLSVEQAAALRDLAVRAFTEHGVPVESDGRDLVRHGSMVYGLTNLARLVGSAPWPEWRGLIDGHTAAMVAARATPKEPESVDPEQWRMKLRAVEDLPQQLEFDSPSGLPGIVALPAIDHPSHVAEMMGLDGVREHADLDAFRHRAVANLRELPPPVDITALPEDREPEGQFAILTFDDFYGAARALVLDHVLQDFLKVESVEHGCLIGIPTRHHLLVHVLTGSGVLAAIPNMINMVDGLHDNEPGPIINELYYVPWLGASQQITRHGENEVNVLVNGLFEQELAKFGIYGEN